MILTRSADYALRALVYLAQCPREQSVPLDAIAQAQKVPSALLSKILQALVKGGLVRSRKGYGGGYVLAREAREITLVEVVELVDGPFTVFECLADESFCELCSNCKIRAKFSEMQEALLSILGRTTLRDVLPDRALPTATA